MVFQNEIITAVTKYLKNGDKLSEGMNLMFDTKSNVQKVIQGDKELKKIDEK